MVRHPEHAEAGKSVQEACEEMLRLVSRRVIDREVRVCAYTTHNAHPMRLRKRYRIHRRPISSPRRNAINSLPRINERVDSGHGRERAKADLVPFAFAVEGFYVDVAVLEGEDYFLEEGEDGGVPEGERGVLAS